MKNYDKCCSNEIKNEAWVFVFLKPMLNTLDSDKSVGGSVPSSCNCYLNYPISLLILENIFVRIPSNHRLKPALASLFP